MTEADLREAEAAEFVIGIMPDAERSAFSRRLREDADLAGIVSRWEDRFTPFNTAYAAEQPPQAVKTAIDKRLFGDEKSDQPWMSRLALWLGATAAACLALAFLISLSLFGETTDLIARLEAIEDGYSFEARYDRENSALDIVVLGNQRPPDRDLELWAIDVSGVPVSLGVLPDDGQITVAPDIPMSNGVTLAVSLEPIGGSPTGAPTGVVLSAGILSDV